MGDETTKSELKALMGGPDGSRDMIDNAQPAKGCDGTPAELPSDDTSGARRKAFPFLR